MGEKKAEVRLSRIVLVEGHEQQFIQLREARPAADPPRELTMVIGPVEAREIRRCLEGEGTPRPLTHELAFRIMKTLQVQVREAVIHDLRGGTFFAELRIDHDGSVIGVDCRPSDAIALSLRGSTPVFVTDHVFEAAKSP